MKTSVSLAAERRDTTGKGMARQLRRAGKVPAVIYGRGREPELLIISALDLEKTLSGHAAESTIIDLTIDGRPTRTLIREVQRHPVRPQVLHVDFYEVHEGERITLDVPIHLEGNPDGVRNGGGVLDQHMREIEIEVLPRDIPERVTLDVTALGLAQSLHVRDLHIENAEILADPDQTVCTVIPPRGLTEEEEAAAAAAAAEEAEGGEPELIRKPKAEGAEGEEGEAGEPEG